MLPDDANFPEAQSSLTDSYRTTVPEIIRRYLRLDKRGKIRYRIKSTGEVVMERVTAMDESDPALAPLLAFPAHDIVALPAMVRSFPPELVERARALVKNVDIEINAPLSPDDE
ncbi:regulator [Trinickia dabaoshanensis]|uniref:Regulator n=2 Tax=Trinickia dabaoshanensis TaxID=564714 RepID=A0A2N7VUU6_9BURK|nr:regulator [Trinickia dabaoshanensis]